LCKTFKAYNLPEGWCVVKYTSPNFPLPSGRRGRKSKWVSGGVFGFTVKVFFGGVVAENQAGAVELYRRASGRRSGVPDTEPASNDA